MNINAMSCLVYLVGNQLLVGVERQLAVVAEGRRGSLSIRLSHRLLNTFLQERLAGRGAALVPFTVSCIVP